MQDITQHEASSKAFAEAQEVIAGGVNSPVRAFASVGLDPIFYDIAKGAYVYDIDGNKYLDFVCSWGPMILGHAYPPVLDAAKEALAKSSSFGAPCLSETKLAKKIVDLVDSIEKVRFVSSGTEATMSAIRLARGYTKRDKFIKFEGNYHGHSDSLLVSAGSGVATFNIPGTPGVTQGAVKDTLLAKYNDLDSVRELFEANPDDIAAIILEPIAGNMGCVKGKQEFLEGLRELCDKHGALLIFDEVISGFRASLQGAQGLNGITPDLSCFGKIIGGGFAVGAFGGKAEIMDYLAPEGPVYQAGTLSGNPVAMAAGLAMIESLEKLNPYGHIEAVAKRLEDGLNGAIDEFKAPLSVNRAGSVLTLFFTDKKVENWDDASTCDTEAFAKYFAHMTKRGFLIAPSQFECLFISNEHTEEHIDAFVAAAREAFEELYA